MSKIFLALQNSLHRDQPVDFKERDLRSYLLPTYIS